MELKRIDLSFGQVVPLHRHPCAVVGYVARGTIHFQIEGEGEREFHAGDAFFERKDTVIAHFDNASGGEPASLLSADESRLIEMLERTSPRILGLAPITWLA